MRPITAFFFLASALVVSESPRAEDMALVQDDLTGMSLQELSNLEVTSVSKASERLSDAPAAIYVITRDEIIGSGARTIAEALRLAPNLLVTQLTSSDYAVSARGFGGNPAAQNFSNKLLILIDGRAVYSPLFSGVYLDAQDVMLADVDRIEVLSGPQAALWGANAVNGVINIVTRKAEDTQGVRVEGAGGNVEQAAEMRYGMQPDSDSALRVYGKSYREASMQLADGSSAQDDWYRAQTGFRYDRSQGADGFTVQGDIYRALEGQGEGAARLPVDGGNALARWRHSSAQSELEFQVYYDFTERGQAPEGAFVLHTWDASVQQTLTFGSRDRLVWGAGERLNSYDIHSTALAFVPSSRNLTLGNVFAQNTLEIIKTLKLTTGVKLEDDPYAGWQFLPNVRLSWEIDPALTAWAAASRAIRSPTPFDVDVQEHFGPTLALLGDEAFKPERVTAYELGFRALATSRVSLSVSGFYSIYEDLRSIEFLNPPNFFPLGWGNSLQGDTLGIEAWLDFQVASWWRVSPGLSTVSERLSYKPGASAILGTTEAGNDPSGHASIKSSMDFGHGLSLNGIFRYVASLPQPALPHYTEVDAKLNWQPCRQLSLFVAGQNLLHQVHLEYPTAGGQGEFIRRSVFAGFTWQP
jgi:iron complex outermembrane receptor protein